MKRDFREAGDAPMGDGARLVPIKEAIYFAQVEERNAPGCCASI
jgi:hypothetical protein